MNARFSTRQLAYTAMGVALITVCSWLSIQLPSMVPVTLQTFAVCLVTALLGLRLGLWAVGAYILLAAVGVPVLSGFRGGVAALLGVTGGYVIGFLFTALIVGLVTERTGRRFWPAALGMAAGILVCYAFGTAWFILVYTRTKGAIGVLAALNLCVFPYLIPDAVKLALAAFLAGRLYPLIHRGGTV